MSYFPSADNGAAAPPSEKQYRSIAMNNSAPQQALELFGQDIAEEEGQLASQAAAIARLAKEGRDTTLAEELMRTLEAQLNARREATALQPTRVPAPANAIS